MRTTAAHPQNWNDPDGKLAAWSSFASRCWGIHFAANQPTNRRRYLDMSLSAAQALLIDKGIELSNQLHSYLSNNSQARDSKTGDYTNNPTMGWNHKFLFLALLGYAASMAKFSDLDRDDFQQLAMGFYDYVLVQRGDK